MEIRSENQAVIELMENLYTGDGVKVLVKDEKGPRIVAHPDGWTVADIKELRDKFLDRPERKKGGTLLRTVDAFSDFVNRHKTDDSILFLDDTAARPKLLAVFDAHAANAEKAGLPDWQEHRASYEFPLSAEWEAWTRPKLQESYEQAAFAEFLEDRIADVIDPAGAGKIVKEYAAALGLAELATPAKLMALSRNLNVTVEQQVKQQTKLQSGETVFTYIEQHKDGETGQELKMPGAFAVGIPVLRGATRAYSIPVRLRYRLANRKVHFLLQPQRMDEVLEEAIVDATKVVGEKTGLPVFRGKPA